MSSSDANDSGGNAAELSTETSSDSREHASPLSSDAVSPNSEMPARQEEGRWSRGTWKQVKASELPGGLIARAAETADQPTPAAAESAEKLPAAPTAADTEVEGTQASPGHARAPVSDAPKSEPAPTADAAVAGDLAAADAASASADSSSAATADKVSGTTGGGPTTPLNANHVSPKHDSDPSSVRPTVKPKLQLERRQTLEHHIRSNPTDLDAYMELGKIYRGEERPLEARRVLQQALQIFPDEMGLRWEFEEATLARSLQQLREVTELAGRLDTLETERELNRCQQDWAFRRMDVCRARLARDPSLRHLKVVLGEALYDAGMYEGAIEELESVVDDDNLSASANLIRGRCLLAMGKELEAMSALRACALRRAVVAPLRTRVMALKLLCETAERLGIPLTLATYRQQLHAAEQELAKQNALGS